MPAETLQFTYDAETSSFVKVADHSTNADLGGCWSDTRESFFVPVADEIADAVRAPPPSAEPPSPDPVYKWRWPTESVYTPATLQTATTLLEVSRCVPLSFPVLSSARPWHGLKSTRASHLQAVEVRRKRYQAKHRAAAESSNRRENVSTRDGAGWADDAVVVPIDKDERRGRFFFFSQRRDVDLTRLAAERKQKTDSVSVANRAREGEGNKRVTHAPLQEQVESLSCVTAVEVPCTALSAKKKPAPHLQAARDALHEYWMSSIKCYQIADTLDSMEGVVRDKGIGDSRDDPTT